MCTHASSAKNQTEIFNILYRVYRTVQYYCCHCCPLKVGKWSIYYQDLFLIGAISQSKSRKPSPTPPLPINNSTTACTNSPTLPHQNVFQCTTTVLLQQHNTSIQPDDPTQSNPTTSASDPSTTSIQQCGQPIGH